MVSLPSLAIIARYFRIQPRQLFGMVSPNVTPFASFYTHTDSTCTDLKLYCARLSYEKDVSKLQVGEIEFRTDESLSRHVYVKFGIS